MCIIDLKGFGENGKMDEIPHLENNSEHVVRIRYCMNAQEREDYAITYLQVAYMVQKLSESCPIVRVEDPDESITYDCYLDVVVNVTEKDKANSCLEYLAGFYSDDDDCRFEQIEKTDEFMDYVLNNKDASFAAPDMIENFWLNHSEEEYDDEEIDEDDL